MKLDVSFVSEVPDIAAFRELLVDYYVVIIKVLEEAGGPSLSPQEMAQGTLDHLDEILPPNGRLALVRDQDGRLMGCGTMRRIGPEAAEMKRMFIRPEAQGQRLGRKLFEMRMAEARKMGCKSIYADTVKGNRAMLAMYEKYGFQYVSRYPGNANPEELAPFISFMEYRFPD